MCVCSFQTTGSVSSGVIRDFPLSATIVPGPVVNHASFQVCTAHTSVPVKRLDLFIYFEGPIHFRPWDGGAARMLQPCVCSWAEYTRGPRSLSQEAQLGAEPGLRPPSLQLDPT